MLFDKAKSTDKTSLKQYKSIRYWHRPAGGLNEVVKRMQEKGVNDPTQLTNIYLELYVASLLGMALQHSEKVDFWIAKPDSDPPDMVLMTLNKLENKGILFSTREIEVVRHISNDITLEERILRKDRPYPEDYILVCFIQVSGKENLGKLSENLVPKLKHIKHVFVVFHGVLLDSIHELDIKKLLSKVSLVQLAPVYDYQVFDITESFKQGFDDGKKLIYVEGVNIYYGIREGDSYPNIINE